MIYSVKDNFADDVVMIVDPVLYDRVELANQSFWWKVSVVIGRLIPKVGLIRTS